MIIQVQRKFFFYMLLQLITFKKKKSTMKLTSGISTHLFFITNKSVTPNNYLKKFVSLKFILYEHNVNEI